MNTRAASTRRFERLRWIAVGAPVAFLAAFHGALLLRHVGDASIAQPMVLGRWAFGIALLIGAFIARRFFSRRRVAIAFWLLAAVLHLAVPVGGHSIDDIALLAAALPALIVFSAASAGYQNVPWPASAFLRIQPVMFASSRRECFHSDRAPPRF
ncbi:MAG: hypothetical protein QOC81_60 [Thermoanaerobaculia bacterium]|jgi:hypothetical protein|nr:hypothetical protein [Thermoanaerobaculia bacterium]